jgi:hypothetical protein
MQSSTHAQPRWSEPLVSAPHAIRCNREFAGAAFVALFLNTYFQDLHRVRLTRNARQFALRENDAIADLDHSLLQQR